MLQDGELAASDFRARTGNFNRLDLRFANAPLERGLGDLYPVANARFRGWSCFAAGIDLNGSFTVPAAGVLEPREYIETKLRCGRLCFDVAHCQLATTLARVSVLTFTLLVLHFLCSSGPDPLLLEGSRNGFARAMFKISSGSWPSETPNIEPEARRVISFPLRLAARGRTRP